MFRSCMTQSAGIPFTSCFLLNKHDNMSATIGFIYKYLNELELDDYKNDLMVFFFSFSSLYFENIYNWISIMGAT